ncbi:hypothetical protein [Halobacillus mangrovi]|uniref:hypothetical protein n=1 Tax=Halobacillus mangrovi TaxID=402384 RepID=UPI003D95D633
MNQIAWKLMLFFLFLIILPNILVMQVQLVGPIDDFVGIGTALDLVVILPLLLYFFGFKKRVSWVVLVAFMFLGLLLANWVIPQQADGYLSYFNHSVIMLEALVIFLELVLLIAVVKRFPLLIENYKIAKESRYHFLSSFTHAIQQTFSFKINHLNKFQSTLRILATDIAAIYYSLFSWRKTAPVIPESQGSAFSFHKDGSYLAVFIMLVHAMAIEIIAVHVMVAMYSHTLAWILTAFDVYALLFIISDYQAIRLAPVVLDQKGIHFQKGIRYYGFIPWKKIDAVMKNTKTPEEVARDRNCFELALHGLEKEFIPYVVKLKEPVEIRRFFGFKKRIQTVYVKVDEPGIFYDRTQRYMREDK